MKYISIAVFACMLLTGCQEIGTNDLPPQEGKIVFGIGERHEEYGEVSDPLIHMFLSTEKIYPCCNYLIVTDHYVSGNNIEVEIRGIRVPEGCLTALGPANTSFFLPLSPQSYSLEITGADYTDHYTVEVTDSTLEISGDPTEHTVPARNRVRRYPPRSFVYLFGSLCADTVLSRQFLDTLRSVVEVEEFTFPANVDIPYQDSSSGYYCNMAARYFYYDTEEDFDRVGNVLRDFTLTRLTDKEGIGISVRNWRNRFFASWIFEE
ncbi:MAG: hypothetical protein U5N56_03875 [Candidatus Marinimicrobia bacterium]|nr:hypothetical protein [Candidatus Neomarinimicrobiota bacterium]